MSTWLWIALGVIVVVGFTAFTGAPYVPSRRRDIKVAFRKLRPLTKSDVLVDIGAGDGIVLREAVRAGASRAVGYEIHPILVIIARLLSWRDQRVSIRLANFWRTPLPSDTTVVYLFGDGRDIARMHRRIASEATRLRRPIDAISYAFEFPGLAPITAEGAYFLYRIEP